MEVMESSEKTKADGSYLIFPDRPPSPKHIVKASSVHVLHHHLHDLKLRMLHETAQYGHHYPKRSLLCWMGGLNDVGIKQLHRIWTPISLRHDLHG